MIESQRHSYHLVDPSPWPISGSLGALATIVGGVMYMHSFQGGATLLSFGLIFILYTMFVWWRDVLRESTFEGHHTKVVQLGPRYGFILFIVSEVMFFFALFRTSSHSSLAPTVEIGGIWPLKGIAVLDPWEIPFLNTLIPPSSGAAVTWAHHAILAGKEKRAVYALVATVSLALVFIGFQGMEYYQAPFTISDSIYGSTFFLATGFHGFHVIIGTLFSIICGIRQYLGHLTKEHHVGFEAAAWYWHFVDVVQLFPFVSIYWWGGIEEIMADHVHQEMTRNLIFDLGPPEFVCKMSLHESQSTEPPVAGESLIKEQILERFFIDLVAGESLIKERAAARFNDLVGSTDVVAGEPLLLLLLPRRLRQNRAWLELNKIWRTNTKVKGFIIEKVKGGRELQSPTSSISAAPAGTGTEVATTNHLATVVEQQNFPLQVFELEEESLFDTTDLIFDGLCEQLISLHSMNPIPKLSQFSSAQAEEVVELAERPGSLVRSTSLIISLVGLSLPYTLRQPTSPESPIKERLLVDSPTEEAAKLATA
nr:cytochrome C oxidase subunit 3 [Ipomoea batatas]